jgi:hypothetical protein
VTIDSRPRTRRGPSPAQHRRPVRPPSNQLLSGPPEQWVEQLAVLTREYGFTGYILAGDDPTAIARFGREVAPALRELVAAERASTSGGPATATDAGR